MSFYLFAILTIICINLIVVFYSKIMAERLCFTTLSRDIEHSNRSVSAELKFPTRKKLEDYLFNKENSEYYSFKKMRERRTITLKALGQILSITAVGLLFYFGADVRDNPLRYNANVFLYIQICSWVVVFVMFAGFLMIRKKVNVLFLGIGSEYVARETSV